YTSGGGHVSANLAWNHHWLTLEVSDSGIGIPADQLPHIWEEFFRARNARARERHGTGLGLSIAKQLIENYGGQIGVRSVEHEGTTFTIQLPLLSAGQRPGAGQGCEQS